MDKTNSIILKLALYFDFKRKLIQINKSLNHHKLKKILFIGILVSGIDIRSIRFNWWRHHIVLFIDSF